MNDEIAVSPAPPVFKYIDSNVIVLLNGNEIPFDEYESEQQMPESSLLLSYWNENGWGDDTSSVYLAAPGVVIYSRVCEDHREASLHENVVDVPGLVLDLAGGVYVSWLAVQAYGPLFNGDCSQATRHSPTELFQTDALCISTFMPSSAQQKMVIKSPLLKTLFLRSNL